jgi:SAM-dependent methyltransferase
MLHLSEKVAGLFACPMCLTPLSVPGNLENGAITCGQCRAVYPVNEHGQLDVRLRSPKTYPIDFQIDGLSGGGERPPQLEPIPANPSPAFDYNAVAIPPILTHGNRLTRELLSYFPVSKTGGAMLDLGCGDEDFKQISSVTNLEYVGVDYAGGDPKILADAHSLPFKDQAFDFIISFAVLEHIRYPFVAIREALRVLKPGGTFIGTVAFLEPFHMDSYYHPSHLGTWNLLHSAGFEVKHLEPNRGWMNLVAQSQMSLFPHAPRALARAMVLPVELMHRLWWKLGNAVQNRPATSEKARQTANTGGFRFVCTRPAMRMTHPYASAQSSAMANV